MTGRDPAGNGVQVRLGDATGPGADGRTCGRVEVQRGGVWGSVCSDGWSAVSRHVPHVTWRESRPATSPAHRAT